MIQYMEYGDALSVCDMALLTTYDVSFFLREKDWPKVLVAGTLLFARCKLPFSIMVTSKKKYEPNHTPNVCKASFLVIIKSIM